ncbi:MAG: doxX subfamily protein [Acidimicrobiales bacterium]|nr:doxX subfamily protein [Acidimicrobiales bacterium]
MIIAGVDLALTDSWYKQVSLGILGMRVLLGLTLAAHGYNKFFGGGRIPGTARWFDSMGMRPNGKVHAILAASTELGSGVLLAAGALTPLAGAGFVGLMIVAWWTVHRPNGFFIVKSGWEYNMILAAMAVGLATIGPGRYSVDWAIGLDLAFKPGPAFALSLGLGVLGGLALLVGCYRPPAPAEK